MPDKNKQIFLWYGDNDLEITEKIANWKEAFAKKHGDYNIVSIDFANTEGKDKMILAVKNALTVSTLFGANKLVILKNFFSELKKIPDEAQKIIIESLADLAQGFFLIFAQKEKPAANLVSLKKIKKAVDEGVAEIQEFVAPKIFEMEKWLLSRAKKKSAELTGDGARILASMVGNDLWLAESELQKLTHFKNNQKITVADVQELTVGKFNEDIFGLMDAISGKDKKKALKLLAEQTQNGVDDMYLLTMLTRQFRLLWQAKELSAKGFISSDVLAREMGVHPFVVKKLIGFLPKFELMQIRKIYQQLLDFEIKIKTGRADFRLLAEMMIVEIK